MTVLSIAYRFRINRGGLFDFQFGPGAVVELDRLADILDPLEPRNHRFRWVDGRVLRDPPGHKEARLLAGAGIFYFGRDERGHLRLQQKVDEGHRLIFVRRRHEDAQVVLPDRPAFLGDHGLDGRPLVRRPQDGPAPSMGQDDLAGDQKLVIVLARVGLHQSLLRHQPRLGRFQLRGLRRVQGLTGRAQGHPEHFPFVVEEADLALVARIPERLPALGGWLDQIGVVTDAGRAPEIRHRIGVLWIVVEALEVLVDMGEVRDFSTVQPCQQPLLDEDRDHVVRGYHHIVARGPALEFRQQLLVRAEGVGHHLDAESPLELLDNRLLRVVRPREQMQRDGLRLSTRPFLRRRARHNGEQEEDDDRGEEFSCGWRRMGSWRSGRAYRRACGASTAKGVAQRGCSATGPALLFGLLHFRCTHVATATNPIDTSTRIADSAFTSGVTADFSMPYTLIGSVVEPTPAVKKLMMKSSSESVKAISSAPTMPGISSGSVTRLKAIQGVAPRSSAASSSRGSSLRSRARTISATTGKLKIVWAMIIVKSESGTLIITKKSSIATPIMISGMTIGMSSSPSKAPCQRNGCRSSATAVSTPSTPASTVETVATMRLFTVAASSAWSVKDR